MPRSFSDLGDEVVFLERYFESSASQLQTQRSDKHALTRSRVSGDDATVEVISVQLGGSQPAMGNRWELDHNDAPRGVVHKAGSIPADPRLPEAGWSMTAGYACCESDESRLLVTDAGGPSRVGFALP